MSKVTECLKLVWLLRLASSKMLRLVYRPLPGTSYSSARLIVIVSKRKPWPLCIYTVGLMLVEF